MSPPPVVVGWTPDDAGPTAGSPNDPGWSDAMITLQTIEATRIVPSQHQEIPTQPDSPTSESDSIDSDFEEEEQPRKAAGWVPRPRNPFIIFRCEFSKENTRSILEAQGVHVPEHHDKSLSKRASEAWNRLTPAEKRPFEELARKEKEVHARDNPDYKFRPKKRTSAPTSSHSSPQSPRPSTSRRKSPATSLRGHDRTRSMESTEGKRRIRAPPFPQNGRRHKFRSPSVNHLPMPSIPSTASTPPLPSDDLPIPRPKRRSRSLTGIDWMEIQYFGSSSRQDGMSSSQGEIPHGSMYQGPNFGNGFYMTPLAAVSSSLANWNGEYSKPAISVSQDFSAFSSSFPTSPASSDAPSITIVSPGTSEPSTITQIPTYFTTAGRTGVANPDVMWGTSSDIPAAEYFPILPSHALDDSTISLPDRQQTQFTPLSSLTEAERAHALHEFDLGLSEKTDFQLFSDMDQELWSPVPGMIWVDGEAYHDAPTTQ